MVTPTADRKSTIDDGNWSIHEYYGKQRSDRSGTYVAFGEVMAELFSCTDVDRKSAPVIACYSCTCTRPESAVLNVLILDAALSLELGCKASISGFSSTQRDGFMDRTGSPGTIYNATDVLKRL